MGTHVTQKGSLVEADRLRFDFSHMKPITPDEIDKIEGFVNSMVETKSDVKTRLMTPKEAVDNGALALFGEKYGEEVRVLSMGDEKNRYFSTELCGGTHVRNTSDIGKFKIISQSSIAAGVRRVEALRETLLHSGFTPEISMDIMGAIWSKFVLNCGINPVCAISGLRAGEVARNVSADEMQTQILEEVMSVVEAKGINLDNDDMVGYVKKLTRMRYNKPSMQQHMEAGRPTEIDSLNGALVREAKKLGISVPFNEALVFMVKARETAMTETAKGVEKDYAKLEAEAEAEEK